MLDWCNTRRKCSESDGVKCTESVGAIDDAKESGFIKQSLKTISKVL